MKKLLHNSGIEGNFIREFYPTGSFIKSYMIQLSDGRKYCAPSNEFTLITSL